MSLEDDDTSNLPELTPISSNQHAKKAIQNSAITTVDSSVNVSLKTLIEQQAAMSSNIDKLTYISCYQLRNLTPFLRIMLMLNRTQEVAVQSPPSNSL